MRPVRFFGEILGLEVAFDAANTVELTAGNGDRIQLFGPGHRYFEFYRSHGGSTVPLLEVDDLDQARPSWPAAAPSYSASGVRRHLDLAHLPGARREHPQPGRPHGVAGRQRRLWANALDMRQKRTLTPQRAGV